jgi:serine protease Do
MIRKSLAFVLLGIAAGTAAFAQTPEPQSKADTKVFSMFFDGDGGYLGIQTQDVTKENFSKFGLRDVRGVAIEKVIDGSPAQAAGLQAADVITRFNGEEITSVKKLTRLISEVAADHQVKLTVLRSGSEREIAATLAKRPMPKFEEGSFGYTPHGNFQFPEMPDLPDFNVQIPPMEQFKHIPWPQGGDSDTFVWRGGSSRQIGVNVSPLTKQLGDHFGVPDGGALINNVRENSPAAKAGLKAGDVIVEINGKPVKGDFDLIRELGSKKEREVTLTIVRDRIRQTVRVTPEEVKGNGFFEFPQSGEPGKIKLVAPKSPGTPATPVPMNHFFFPGRVL